ncbi:MAG: quinol:electron acceptor oxidoreductase subunit ActD [Acidobacteriota bacterium]
MDIAVDAPVTLPLIAGRKSAADVTRDVCGALDARPSGLWWAGLAISAAALLIGVAAVSYQIATGIGTWGLNTTVGWAFDITNFVFWIGIGHAGTLISAILFLLRQRWRTSVNRAAEAMTLFAVMCAGLFPLIHMGRPWLFFWVFPYPNTRGPLWINFRSPLVWDFFAISTYFTISAIFWYIGLLPDLATIRDRDQAMNSGPAEAGRRGRTDDGLVRDAQMGSRPSDVGPGASRIHPSYVGSGFSRIRGRIFGWLSLGWNGAYSTWHRYEVVYLLLAGLATPLVLSVHTIVSMDFATAMVPGWHTTIFPPYFVAGAIFSGMAMVLTLMLVARKTMRLEDYITSRHIDPMCYLVILTSGMVGLAYATELFTALYSGNPYEQFAFINRAFGPLAWGYWIMVACNVLLPHLFWFVRVRRTLIAVFIISLLINVGMWFERFIIIVSSLERDFLPSRWTSYQPSSIEIATLIGSFGLFFTCFLLFCRFVPVIAIAEIKGVLEPPDAAVGRDDAARHQSARPGGERVAALPGTPGGPLLVTVFEREGDAIQATAAARQHGLEIADVFGPYASHGLDRALGLRPTRLPWVCFLLGLSGAVAMAAFQYWATAVSWPINVGGKPWNSLPAFVPVTFEIMVLCAGVGTVAAFLWSTGLRPGRPSTLSDLRLTDDRFALVLRATGAAADRAAVERLLTPFHPVAIEERR